jgi:hypothetical protein
MKHDQYKLCYAEGGWGEGKLYFTDNFETQRGDDWNDTPYECNAGRPYEDDTHKVVAVYFEGGDFVFPNHNHHNSPHNVEDINKGKIAWLRPAEWADHTRSIKAGTEMGEVLCALRYHGAKLFVPENLNQ